MPLKLIDERDLMALHERANYGGQPRILELETKLQKANAELENCRNRIEALEDDLEAAQAAVPDPDFVDDPQIIFMGVDLTVASQSLGAFSAVDRDELADVIRQYLALRGFGHAAQTINIVRT